MKCDACNAHVKFHLADSNAYDNVAFQHACKEFLSSILTEHEEIR